MYIKICGITSLKDALIAIDAGADYLGFNFYPPSPRALTPGACAEITSVLEKEFPAIKRVGVFVNMSVEQVTSILNQCHLDLAQLHGDESPRALAALKERAFKAVRLATDEGTNRETNKRVPNFTEYTLFRQGQSPSLLVDAAVKGAYGGTGIPANWLAAAELAKRHPVLLAGGLTPSNVAEAVRQVQPWGVDVASGVESRPGKKDARKMKAFVQAARAGTAQ